MASDPHGRRLDRPGMALVWRSALLLAALAAFAWTLSRGDAGALRIVAGIACVAALWGLRAQLLRSERDMARFVEAVGHGDLSQRFDLGGGDGLGAALDRAMRRLRDERTRLAEEARYHAALVDEAPVALLTVDGAGQVGLANKAARRLLGPHDGLYRDAFAGYGPELLAALDPAGPAGPRRLATIVDGSTRLRTTISIATVARAGGPLRLVAIQPIQHELAAAEVAAQTDLVRVLTHEIMNSMTPVTSLARSAADLMAGLPDDGANGARLADARTAIAIAARRAEGLLAFVDSYRQVATLPPVHRRRFAAGPWGLELGRLLAATDHGRDVMFTLALDTPQASIDADPDLLCQAVINLLKNGAEAAAHAAGGAVVTLTIAAAADGGALLSVTDNGPGIPASLARDMFLPFFTTKRDGAGVGLSVARQIVVAHGGTIQAGPAPDGGGGCVSIHLGGEATFSQVRR